MSEELEALRRDAARYHKLREQCDLPAHERMIFCPPAPAAACASAAELDAVVDAEMEDNEPK